jgi:hypothetical protein
MKGKRISQWRKEYLRILENGPRPYESIKDDHDELKFERCILSDLIAGDFIKCSLYLDGNWDYKRVSIGGFIFADKLRKELEEESFKASFTRIFNAVASWLFGVASAVVIYYLTK